MLMGEIAKENSVAENFWPRDSVCKAPGTVGKMVDMFVHFSGVGS